MAFDRLKETVTSAPILVHYHHDRAKMIETDAPDLALGGVLNQKESDARWHPVAFAAQSFNPAQINYVVHDKAMLAIVNCFMEWEHMLISVPCPTLVYTGHHNLEYFKTTKVLNHRQA